MDDEETLHRFGTPLPTLEKDVVPAKKPLAIEDQIVKDENGKRRFHGAFTGGFSAGFWNTVGSLEGWTPQTFKSSRAEKATPRVQQRPEDFMDKEDLGEFGIAPQGIRTREEFSKESEEEQRTGQRKRKLMQPEQVGPIPGVPVLEHLLRPVRDKVAVRILKSMGWKPGQGVGPRQTRKEKRQTSARNKREQYLLEHYGAEGLPSKDQKEIAAAEEGFDDDDDEEEEDITFAPDDYEPIFYTPKENRFGMSYSGLSRDPILSKSSSAHPAAPMQHINLFGQLETQPKQKQLSIRGQAFGVGAFEEEDDDIYARDDMTRYDFSLADKKPKQKKLQHVQQRHVIDGFSEDKSGAALQKPYAIDLPRDFKPRNWLQHRSRFEPMDSERTKKLEARNEYKRTGLGRHDLNPDQRAQLLGEQKSQKEDQQQQQPPSRNPFKERSKLLDLINAKSEGFTKGGLITVEEPPKADTETTATAMVKQVKEANASIQEKAVLKTKDLASTTPSGGFKPFLADEAKQQRYDKFLDAQLKTDAEITEFLANMQPVTLSLWDREMEKKEFIQAAKIYRPLNGLMYDRFVSEATVQAEQVKEQQKPLEERKVVMERTKTMWKPASLLCKRYNIAEPFGGSMLEPPKELKGKAKISIFDYLETSINSKADFQTPTIRPKHMEKPKPAVVAPPPLAPLAPPTATTPEPEKEKPAQKKEEEPTTAKATFVPRTPLEQAVDDSREKPISEKKDLFRSIFEDSDDEETVTVAPPLIASLSTPQEKLAAINEALGLPSTSAASASALNVLRNTSPPRGIFAALFKPLEELPPKEAAAPPKFTPIEGNKLKIAYKSREERLRNDKELAMAQVPAEDIYGPKLPEKGAPARTQAQEIDHAEVGIEAKLQHLWQKHAPTKRTAEKWVEKKALSSADSDSDSSSDTSSSCSTSSPAKAKKSKLSKSKKSSHRSSSSKKSKKSEKKSKKKSKSKSKKSSDRSKPKAKKKKSKH